MKHICYLDKRTEDLTNLASGRKTMVMRGVKYKSPPYECVFPGDSIYFSSGKNYIVLGAIVEAVKNIKKPKPLELKEILKENEESLILDQRRTKKLGKYSYFVLLELGSVSRMEFPKMDDIIYEDEGFWVIGGDSSDKKINNKGIRISLRLR